MNRNSEAYFSELPKIDIGRSIFNRPFSHKTSFNVGQVIPFYVDEVIPGDSHNITTSVVCRLQTLLSPIMDNLYLDTYYFFVPMRLVFAHTKNFFGENDNGPWIQDQVKYQIPYLIPPPCFKETEGVVTTKQGGFEPGSLADYMGIPVNKFPLPYGTTLAELNHSASVNSPSALPFRAYALIINEFFRDQNIQQPLVVHTDDTIRHGVRITDPWDDDAPVPCITGAELGGVPFVAARFHDYFSSCLPAPQKSESISIFGNTIDQSTFAPVISIAKTHDVGDNPLIVDSGLPESFVRRRLLPADNTQATTGINGSSSLDYKTGLYPVNLWANLNIPEATITQLRLAFQLQKYFERSASSGSRYREYLAGFFGVSNGDARMQIPEYLGGHRVPLSIHQVANTGKSVSADLGDLGAMSNTSDVHEDFHSSFSEWGYILGLCVVRYDNTYSQGLEKMWSRRDPLDFYNPVFAHISEQPVYRREIGFGAGELSPETGAMTCEEIDKVFGYQEAWADYRYKPSRVSGEMRPEVNNTLAYWHLADDYDEVPTLSDEWLQTDVNTVDRVLAVGHDVSNQVFADFYIQNKCVRPMPVHSIPGLADHF